jgi:hypothetical protein
VIDNSPAPLRLVNADALGEGRATTSARSRALQEWSPQTKRSSFRWEQGAIVTMSGWIKIIVGTGRSVER